MMTVILFAIAMLKAKVALLECSEGFGLVRNENGDTLVAIIIAV
jgi:hypothetical protein